jgi:hypothetical protein
MGQMVAFTASGRDMVIDHELVGTFNTLDVFVWTN